jgi:hypothetical protein
MDGWITQKESIRNGPKEKEIDSKPEEGGAAAMVWYTIQKGYTILVCLVIACCSAYFPMTLILLNSSLLTN